jgi:hypothetical protein
LEHVGHEHATPTTFVGTRRTRAIDGSVTVKASDDVCIGGAGQPVGDANLMPGTSSLTARRQLLHNSNG